MVLLVRKSSFLSRCLKTFPELAKDNRCMIYPNRKKKQLLRRHQKEEKKRKGENRREKYLKETYYKKKEDFAAWLSFVRISALSLQPTFLTIEAGTQICK